MISQNSLTKIITYLTIIFLFLFPLFFLPLTTDFFFFNKLTLLIFFSGFGLLLWLAKIITTQKISLRHTPLTLPLLLLGATYLLTTLLGSPNQIEAFTNVNGPTLILSLTVFYLVLINNLEKKSLGICLHSLLLSIGLLSVIAIWQFAGVAESLNSPAWLKNKLFTPAGETLSLITLFVTGFVLTLKTFLNKLRQNYKFNFLYLPLLLLLFLGLAVTLVQALPGQSTSPVLLSFSDSWSIAMETVKQKPLFGVGPGNYLFAFSRFRPLSFNQSPLWNTRFIKAANLPLEILTTAGLLTLIAYLFFLFRLAKTLSRPDQTQNSPYQPSFFIAFIALLLIQLLLPVNPFIFFLLFLLAAFNTVNQENLRDLDWPLSQGLILLTAAVLLVGATSLFWGRQYLASFYFQKSVQALNQNQAGKAYELQIKAINLNRQFPAYHLSFSKLNLLLANSLAAKKDLSDQERQSLTQFIQEAILQAKAAAALNPVNPANWENLASIYQSLINVAQGADQWTVSAYQQAISADPVSPRLRLSLGGLYYSLKTYDLALRQFENAIQLKPDYANSYYNLAAVYREKNLLAPAYQALQMVSNLLPKDSPDRPQVEKELTELKDKIGSSAAGAATPSASFKKTSVPQEELATPSALPKPQITPFNLPPDLGLDQSSASSSISPTF